SFPDGDARAHSALRHTRGCSGHAHHHDGRCGDALVHPVSHDADYLPREVRMNSIPVTFGGQAFQCVVDGVRKPSFIRTINWHFWLTAGVVGFLFFMTNHDVFVSRLPAYAHSGDAVLDAALGT